MTFSILLFSTAIALSGVAAYYSIIGLVTLFPSAALPIIVMGATLEVAKLVSASWLYRNWKRIELLVKYYLTFAVLILSFITSMGIFGFLSKAHIEQGALGAGNNIQLKILEDQISAEQRKLENAQRSLSALDRLVDESSIESAIDVRNKQKRERTALGNQIDSSITTIKDLSEKATPLRIESQKLAAEIGPIKYIADLVYGESDQKTIEKAVRAVIILLVVVFDPLAIVLLIAANKEVKNRQQEKEIVYNDVDAVEIDNKQFTEKPKKKNTKADKIPEEILQKVFKK
jgi:hypothetical protein